MPALPQLNVYYVLILIFIISFFAFILGFAYSIYYWLHKRHHEKKPGRTVDPRDAAMEEAVKIVDDARSKALGLLQEAHIEAKSILHDTEEVQSGTKEMFEEKMKQLAQKQMQAFDVLAQELMGSYKSVLSQEKEESLKSFVDISDALKQQLTSEVRTFAGSMKQVTSDTENNIREGLKTQYDQVSGEMGNLAEKLKTITSEAEQTMKSNLGSQYDLVQTEISGLSESIKKVTTETENSIKSELMGQYENLKNEVGGLADGLKKVTEETETKIKEDINHEYEEARNVVHNFAESLKKATIETENTLKQDVKNEYDQIKQELHDYKKEKLHKVDEMALGMMEEVARDVLGKTMTAKDHEELILRSLDGIKRTTNLIEL